jgi:hypothetical protein
MFSLALFFYVLGFGTILVDARLKENFSLSLACVGGVFIMLAMMSFVGGLLSKKRLSQESHDSLP